MYKLLMLALKVTDFIVKGAHRIIESADSTGYHVDKKAKAIRVEANANRLKAAQRAAEQARDNLNKASRDFGIECDAIANDHPFV